MNASGQKAKVTEQNADLKRQIGENNETILKMGLMFLKMKFSRSQQLGSYSSTADIAITAMND